MLLFKSGFRVRGLGFRKILIPSLLSLLMLSACGFTPIYSQKADNTAIAEKLASVEVKPIKTLMGQQYVNALKDILDPKNMSAVSEYTIEASLKKDVMPLAIERDRTVTRYKVIIVAEYKLKEQLSGKVVSTGTVKGAADYDRVDSDYATYVSENDTTSRVIKELAQDTKIKIISALLR